MRQLKLIKQITNREAESLDKYLQEIGKVDLLSVEAEVELARRIREAPWGRGMLLIAATGWGQDEDRRRALAAGFDRHLTKPMDATALAASLGTWLAEARARGAS